MVRSPVVEGHLVRELSSVDEADVTGGVQGSVLAIRDDLEEDPLEIRVLLLRDLRNPLQQESSQALIAILRVYHDAKFPKRGGAAQRGRAAELRRQRF